MFANITKFLLIVHVIINPPCQMCRYYFLIMIQQFIQINHSLYLISL